MKKPGIFGKTDASTTRRFVVPCTWKSLVSTPLRSFGPIGHVHDAWGHHASCTCPIGPKERNGVLTSDFQVHGTTNLRVVDASVFPKIPGFFIVSAVYM